MAEPHGTRRGRSDWLWLAALAIAFAPALVAQARVWLARDYQSHGFLVPLVAFWMFQAQRRRLPPAGSDPRGLVAIAAAVAVYAAGFLAGDATLQGLALVGAVAGAVLRVYGRAGLRRVAFPVAFLLFMVPVPVSILNPVIVTLQLLVSSAAVEILHTGGYSVLREGNVVLLPGDERLFVDEACSGITSIVTLLPLGAVLAFFTERTALRRLALIAAVIPFAMLGNLVRVLATVAGAQAFGVERVTRGALHDSAGLLTFVFSCLLLIGFGGLLRLLPEAARRPAGHA
jgi:exosortase